MHKNPTTGLSFLNKEIGIFLFPQATSKFQVFSEEIQEYTKQSWNNILEIILMILQVYWQSAAIIIMLSCQLWNLKSFV